MVGKTNILPTCHGFLTPKSQVGENQADEPLTLLVTLRIARPSLTPLPRCNSRGAHPGGFTPEHEPPKKINTQFWHTESGANKDCCLKIPLAFQTLKSIVSFKPISPAAGASNPLGGRMPQVCQTRSLPYTRYAGMRKMSHRKRSERVTSAFR